jgi:negative regulator of flagellin synthesis FlgM
MKITDAYGKFQVTTPATAGTAGATSAKGVAPKTGSAPAHHHKDAGRVEVSEQAKALEAKSAGDSAKIERLKSAISDGSFKVDASKIASKLVGEDDESQE